MNKYLQNIALFICINFSLVQAHSGINNTMHTAENHSYDCNAKSTTNFCDYTNNTKPPVLKVPTYPPNNLKYPKRVQVPAHLDSDSNAPNNGQIKWYIKGNPVAPLKIGCEPGSNYLVKLFDRRTGKAVLSVFVHGGTEVEIKVPLGTYSIKYASGSEWISYTELFGENTSYSIADSIFEFKDYGGYISGYTLQLYKVVNGNLSTTKIDKKDFE